GPLCMGRVLRPLRREPPPRPARGRGPNLLPARQVPLDRGAAVQGGGPTRYDSGNYPLGLELALARLGPGDFRRRQAEARREERYLGLGIGCYVEGTGIGPYEGAHVRIEPSGRVFVATGLTTHGQGHQTTFAQIAADALGCDPADVTVVTGDTRKFNWGAGTFASRALVTSGNAIGIAALKVRDKVLRIAAELLEVSSDDLELAGGVVGVRGMPDTALTLGALATVANPIR